MSTLKSIKAELAARNIAFPAKANKAALSALLAAAPVTVRKQRTSTKAILRSLFPNVGDSMLVADVVAHVTAQAAVAPATIVTMLGDLKNPKYAAGPVISITRVGDSYTRNS